MDILDTLLSASFTNEIPSLSDLNNAPFVDAIVSMFLNPSK